MARIKEIKPHLKLYQHSNALTYEKRLIGEYMWRINIAAESNKIVFHP